MHLGPNKQVHDFVVWNGQTLLAGTSITDSDTVSIYKTTDGGAHWKPYQQNFGTTEQNNLLYFVTKHPQNDKLLYARGDFNVAKSEDAGESWTSIYGSWEGYGEGQFLTIYPSDSDIIWGGGATATFAPHIFKSNDGGVNWTYIDQFYNEAEGTCYDALIHPTDSKQVIVGMGGAVSSANIIRRSQDGGLSWQTVYSGMYTRTAGAKCRQPGNRLCQRAQPVFFARSTDFGQTWQTIDFPDTASMTWWLPQETVMRYLYLGTNKGVFSYTFAE
ncbi:MAG: hypothetical protein U5K69_15980 [Balneolaceae bacterium]|nr:hypothetical protein [Balneolaceae bacterium]